MTLSHEPATDPRSVDFWLAQLRQRHWTVHLFGDRARPDTFAATFKWDQQRCTDVVIVRDERRALAYRTPTDLGTDVFAPSHVLWWYAHNAVWTLRAVLTLDPPGLDHACQLQVVPPLFGLTEAERSPVTIRPT